MPMRFTLADLPQLAQADTVVRVLAECGAFGVTPWLVGGIIRDFLRTGAVSDDIDIVVPEGQSQAVAEHLATCLDGKLLCLDANWAMYRVIVFRPEGEPPWMVDVAPCLGADIVADLGRRDITVNAMAWQPDLDGATDGIFLDPHRGWTDLQANCVRSVAEQNLVDDPLRLLRVFRVAAELDAAIDPETLAQVARQRYALPRVAPERIHYEWLRLLSAPKCARIVRQMADYGLLNVLFPEFAGMAGIGANRYHHLGLADHTLELLVQVEAHAANYPPTLRAFLDGPFTPNAHQWAVLRLACLLHDVAKPPTMAYDAAQDKLMFYGHDVLGAAMVHGIGARYKWGRELSQTVADLVRWHLYPVDVLGPQATPKARHRCFRRVGPLFNWLTPLCIADRFSSLGPMVQPGEPERVKQALLDLWREYQTVSADSAHGPQGKPLLSGRDIMDALDITPGPEIGQTMKRIQQAFAEGEINTREEALALLATFRPTGLAQGPKL